MRPLILASLLAMGVTGCHRRSLDASASPAASVPAVAVELAEAGLGRHVATEEVVGTVRARRRAAIEAKVSGRIVNLPVVPGQTVTDRQTLVELDAAEFRARREQAQAVLEQARRELERFRTLLRQEVVTQAEFDAVESRHRVAEAAASEAETLLGYARITAPFPGVITRKLADLGDLASPGRTLLELEDPASLRFEADVPASLVERVHLGDKLPVVLGSDSKIVEGVVSEIEPSADSASRTLRIRLDLPREVPARAGWFGRARIPTGESRVLTVPQAAVVSRGQLEFVYVVSGGRAALRLVRTGKRLGTDVEILAGLEPGESVVAARPGSLVDGQRVEVP